MAHTDTINVHLDVSEICDACRVKKSRDAAECEVLALKRGNTALILLLMEMVEQHCTAVDVQALGLVFDAGLAANEVAFSVLEAAGFLEEIPGSGYLLKWEKLNERRKVLGLAE